MGLLDALGGLFGGAEEPSVAGMTDPGDPPVPVGRLREAADEAAGGAEVDLDFTLASLDRLDGFAADRDRTFDDPGDADALLEDPEALALGAYFGETLIRAFGGGWEYQGGWSVHLDPGDEPVEVPAFEVAARSLSETPSFRLVADAAAEELEAAGATDAPAEDRQAGADGATDEQPRTVDPEQAAASERRPGGDDRSVTERYRRAAEQLVGMWSDRGLDGSVVSLAHLDRLVTAEAETLQRHDRGLEAAAGYFAEVLRRRHDAIWQRHGGAEVLVLTGPAGTVELDPFRLAADALAGEASFVDRYAEAAAECGLEPPVP